MNLSTDAETDDGDAEIRSASQSKSGLTAHEPISIDGNTNFTSANGVTSGSGTKSDPYIIEGWDINARSGSNAGIDIRHTNRYFIIRNCVIHDGYDRYKEIYNDGISFYDVRAGKIENVTSYNNYYGIEFYISSNNTISNCLIYNTHASGIKLDPSSNNNKITNSLIYNTTNGIYLHSSSNNIITANQIYNNSRDGIKLSYSSNNNLSANHIYNNSQSGIYFKYSSNNKIHYCNVYNNTDYGVNNDNLESQYEVDATNCWWGATNGPYH